MLIQIKRKVGNIQQYLLKNAMNIGYNGQFLQMSTGLSHQNGLLANCLESEKYQSFIHQKNILQNTNE